MLSGVSVSRSPDPKSLKRLAEDLTVTHGITGLQFTIKDNLLEYRESQGKRHGRITTVDELHLVLNEIGAEG